jgi:hypothetical protein
MTTAPQAEPLQTTAPVLAEFDGQAFAWHKDEEDRRFAPTRHRSASAEEVIGMRRMK